jgi:hypothetical protein
MGWEDKVRTYSYSQNRVMEHWCGCETSDFGGELESGDALEALMRNFRVRTQEGEAEEPVAEEAGAREGGRSGEGPGSVERGKCCEIEACRLK